MPKHAALQHEMIGTLIGKSLIDDIKKRRLTLPVTEEVGPWIVGDLYVPPSHDCPVPPWEDCTCRPNDTSAG